MKDKKIWITSSFICIILGTVILTAGRLFGGIPGFYIDSRGIHSAGNRAMTGPLQDKENLEAFDSMEICVDYADVELVVSDEYAIEYCISGNHGEPVCEVNNGRFIFKEADHTSLNVGIFTDNAILSVSKPKYYVRVTIPENKKLSNVSFDIESGNFDIPILQANTLKIINEYGDVCLDKYKGENLDIQMASGTLSIDAMNSARADIKNEYGDVEISRAEGGRLAIQMDTCDCRIDRAEFTDVNIENEYGDVCLGLPGNVKTYGFDLYTEYGEIRMGNENRKNSSDKDEAAYKTSGNSQKRVSISCDSGNIEINSIK